MKKKFLLTFLISLAVLFGGFQGVKAAAPDPPALRNPHDGQSNVLTPTYFQWDNTDADVYYFEYKRDDDAWLSTPVYSNTYIFSNALTDDATYQWRVKACNLSGDGIKCAEYSSVWAFTTPVDPDPTPVVPPSAPVGPSGASNCPPGQLCNPLAYDNFEELIGAIINNFLLPIGSSIAGIMFLIAGFYFVTSAGDATRLKTAKNIMIYTAVGLAVILLASGLTKVIQSLLGG